MADRPRLFLIDGSALAYRSHFAFSANPLTNRRGLHTGAIYGFTTALLRLMEKEKPDYLAVVFDAPEKTFRHEAYPEYKATREKMPDEMADQLPYIRKIVEALGLPFLVQPGFEADDIVGTLVRKAEEKGLDSFICSGDKDFLQLITNHIRIYHSKKGGETEIWDEKTPIAKWNVPVQHVVDLLALMGDSSDNVPGVPGVGEKTAARLIQEFGSLENLYARLADVTPPKLRENLEKHRDQAKLSKELVTIHTEVPVESRFEKLRPGEPDAEKLRGLYEELDFHSLLNSLAGMAVRKTTAETERYRLVDTKEALDRLVQRLRDAALFSFDTETSGLDVVRDHPIGLSFSTREGDGDFVPVGGTLSATEVYGALKPILEDPSRPKGGQNVKFDRLMLQNAGVSVSGVTFDTMIESYLLDPDSRQHNLDALALRHLNIEKIRTEEVLGKAGTQFSLLDLNLERLSHYACEDADVTLRLHRLFEPQIEHQDLNALYRKVELPLTQVLGNMERRGVAVDLSKLKALSSQIAIRTEELRREIVREAGEEFNLNSPKQLGPILFEKLRIQDVVGMKRVKKTKTGYATDQETLEQYQPHKIVALLIEYRNLTKLASTYIDALPTLVNPKTGRLHTSFNQTVAATGRLSSSDPNLQNIPIRTDLGREIRKAFIAGEKGWKILSADYSQIELRILAHLAKDEILTQSFLQKEDIHRRTASLIFGVPLGEVSTELRNRAKAINFGVIYGMGPQRLARETGISMVEAKAFIETYFEKYAAVRIYLDRLLSDARTNGFVTTLLGRRRLLPDLTSSNPRLSSNAERIAVNTPIQGSAADLIKVAMIRIERKLTEGGFRAQMILQVHDELVFELPENEVPAVTELVRHEMEHAVELSVPIVAETGVGPTWADAH